MPSARHQIFNLPDRLAAKANPALIGQDEQHFSAIAHRLRQQTRCLEDRLEKLRRAPGGSGQAAMDRDVEIHRLTAELRVQKGLGLELCLGRIVCIGRAEPVYIGRRGLADAGGHRLLVDWRAPAARPFFAATHANPTGLVSKRRYQWTHGQISDYWDEVFDPDGFTSHASLDDHSAFVASLGSNRSPRMRDVLATIQASQDAIVRADSHGALVVDGGPGTGKTVVSLHRAAYLLHSDPRIARGGGGVLFVGPTGTYLHYVEDVLPSLGEESVQLTTLTGLLPEGLNATSEPDAVVAALKGSAQFEDTIEAAVGIYEQPPTQAMSISTPWADLELSATDWVMAFESADPGTHHNEARNQVWDALLEIVTEQFDDDEVPTELLLTYVSRDEGLREIFVRSWPILDPAGVLADLWSSPAYLRTCAPWLTDDQIQLLQRQDPYAWTTSDLPLLDLARQRIGDPAHVRREQRHRAALAAERDQMAQVVDNLIAADDGEGLVTMLSGEDLKNSLAGESTFPSPDPDRLAGPFGHIVVDEAQELTDAHWRMLLRRCPSRSFTIAGDRSQARHGFVESWHQRLERVGFSQVNLAYLDVNYRTPVEVMAAAEPVIQRALPQTKVPTSVRSTGIPVTIGKVSDLRSIVNNWLSEHPHGTACVIGDQTFRSPTRVRSLSPTQVKGLEFDFVVLVDPEDFGEGIEGAVDRYVAMTRATQELVILTSDRPPAGRHDSWRGGDG